MRRRGLNKWGRVVWPGVGQGWIAEEGNNEEEVLAPDVRSPPCATSICPTNESNKKDKFAFTYCTRSGRRDAGMKCEQKKLTWSSGRNWEKGVLYG